MSTDLTREEKILIEEIKIIQDIIKRMADNSFKIKAWAITLIVATLLIKAKGVNSTYIAYLPLFTFWYLDAFYLQQEKIFRKIFDSKVKNKSKCTAGIFKIDTKPYKMQVSNIFVLMLLNKSITPLYIMMLVLLSIIK